MHQLKVALGKESGILVALRPAAQERESERNGVEFQPKGFGRRIKSPTPDSRLPTPVFNTS